MSVRPSKPSNKRVAALVRIVFSGVSVVYRYSSLREAFAACEAISNAMFRRAQGLPTVPLIKGEVPMEFIGQNEKGEIVTNAVPTVTSTLRIDHISFVGVVCPCCGEQIFDKIKPFHAPDKHDETDYDMEPDEDEPWKEGANG